jgi:predicted DCC family thiol-disulfide oxidoreductase YuxK
LLRPREASLARVVPSQAGNQMKDAERSRHAVVVFDGVCNFCNGSVNFIMRHDREGYLRFAPLQSEVGGELLDRFGVDAGGQDTVVLVEGERAYVRSGAALRIAKRLGGAYPLLYGLMIIPPFIRDFVYDRFARNRYRWFRKGDACIVPSAEVRERFLRNEAEALGEGASPAVGAWRVEGTPR